MTEARPRQFHVELAFRRSRHASAWRFHPRQLTSSRGIYFLPFSHRPRGSHFIVSSSTQQSPPLLSRWLPFCDPTKRNDHENRIHCFSYGTSGAGNSMNSGNTGGNAGTAGGATSLSGTGPSNIGGQDPGVVGNSAPNNNYTTPVDGEGTNIFHVGYSWFLIERKRT